MTTPTLGELIDVANFDTVVRLDGVGGRLANLVLTGDVVDSPDEVLAAVGDLRYRRLRPPHPTRPYPAPPVNVSVTVIQGAPASARDVSKRRSSVVVTLYPAD